jgi:hypothetical protein
MRLLFFHFVLIVFCAFIYVICLFFVHPVGQDEHLKMCPTQLKMKIFSVLGKCPRFRFLFFNFIFSFFSILIFLFPLLFQMLWSCDFYTTFSTPLFSSMFLYASWALPKPAVRRLAQSLKSQLLQSFSATPNIFISLDVTHSHTFLSHSLTHWTPAASYFWWCLWTTWDIKPTFLFWERLSVCSHLNCQPRRPTPHIYDWDDKNLLALLFSTFYIQKLLSPSPPTMYT